MTGRKTLYIYGGRETVSPGGKNFFTYSLLTGSVSGEGFTAVENGRALQDAALKLKNDFVEYIFSLNRLFLDEHMLYKNKISSFFFTDLSNKRTEVFSTYLVLCHLEVIEQAFRGGGLSKIIFDSCPEAFEIACRSRFPECHFDSRETVKQRREKIPLFIHQIKFFLLSGIKIVRARTFRQREPKSKEVNSLFFTIYPLLLNNRFRDEKYGEFPGQDSMFLVSVLTDGMHQQQSISGYTSSIRELVKAPNHILLDRYVRVWDLIIASYHAVRLEAPLRSLMERQYLFRNTDISPYIRVELSASFRRLPRLFMYTKPLSRIFLKYQVKRFIYYLHEFSFGRFMTFTLRDRFPDVSLEGYQHGPVAKRKLLYSLADGEADRGKKDWLTTLPVPDIVHAEDPASKAIYDRQGYPKVLVMDQVYRLAYLKQIRPEAGPRCILIVPGLHDGPNLLEVLRDEIENNPETEYILKPHPRAHGFKKGPQATYNLTNLTVGNDHISAYLPVSREVIVTYSSVGYEAWQLGIPVRLVCLPDRINESPLLDYTEAGMTEKVRIQWTTGK